MQEPFLSRRNFLKGAGALIVGFRLFGPRAVAGAALEPLDSEPNVASLDSWLAVGQDESVTVFTSKVDLGTGVLTALSQIVAEELDVPFARIHMETGDTAHTIDQSQTSGSRTLHKAGPQLRQAAAAGRHELLRLASERLNAPVSQLVVRDGVVGLTGDSTKHVSYGELIGGKRFNLKITASGTGADLKIAAEVPARDLKDYQIVGTSVPRVDLPPKFTGEFTYSQDVRIPGMLHGRAIRPPVANSRPLSVDEASIADIPGVVKVVREGNFVGVVANDEWSAVRAAQALKVDWSAPEGKLPAGRNELFDHLKNTKSYEEESVVDKGNLESGFSQAARVFEASYRWPFQMHGMMGPSCAVAEVREDIVTVWTGSQTSFGTRRGLAALLKRPEKSVRVIYVEGSGCYGRLCADDVPEDAAILSRAVGKPVRVQWSRHDEHGWEPKGPAQLITVRAALDHRGQIAAWDFADRSFPWTSTGALPNLASIESGIQPKGPGTTGSGSGFVFGVSNGGDFYELDNQKITVPVVPWIQNALTPLRTNNLRAPGAVARCFATESLMDEMAASLQEDPVSFRLRHLGNDKRKVEALHAAAQKAGWQARPSPGKNLTEAMATGRGVAVANRDGTMVAAIADVEVDRSTGKVRVTHVTLAHDCGLIVNPNGLQNQIEGNVMQGVSRALLEEVYFDETGVTNLDWNEYPVIRFKEVPTVEIVLLNRPELGYLGAGEAAIVPLPAAIANAVFDATGARVCDIPLTPARVLEALKTASQKA